MKDYLKDPRKVYQNVFGITVYDPKTGTNKFAYLDELNEDDVKDPVNNEIEDLIVRESGMGKSLFRTSRAVAAISDPEDYLQKKSENLVLIKSKLVEKYKEVYPAYLDRYQTPELAFKRAMKDVNAYKTELMSDHAYQFPTRIKDDGLEGVVTKDSKKIAIDTK